MSKANQITLVLFAVVIAITLIRLLLPYGMEDKKNILPEVYSLKADDDTVGYLSAILENNLWDEKRGRLELTTDIDNTTQVDAESPIEPQFLSDSSLQLLGVSRGEGEFFAVIESTDGIKRYASGEVLPDGSQVEEVLEYGVRISKSGQHEQLYLFGKK